MIKPITTDELRRMDGIEGLVLQGCGGDVQEWIDGINAILTEAGVLLDGTRFEQVRTFTHQDTSCLLFLFDGAKLNIGRFAMWRLQTHAVFGGTWLSDFVPNRLGGFVQHKTEQTIAVTPQKPKRKKERNAYER